MTAPQPLAMKPEGLLLQSSLGAALSAQGDWKAFLDNVTENKLLLDVPKPQNFHKTMCSLNLIAVQHMFSNWGTGKEAAAVW